MSEEDDGQRARATDRQRRVWDEEAARYDRSIAFLERRTFGRGRAWIGSRVSGRVLEVAVGTGLCLPHYPPGTDVTGIDLSPNMLAIARRRASDLGLRARLLEGDAQALPFEAASFDTVVCALSLCNIPDPRLAVEEMCRVMSPGGRLLLLDHIGSSWPPVYAVQWLVERVTVRTAGEHYTRRSLPLVRAAGLRVEESSRWLAGTVERLSAVRPGDTAGS